MNSLLRYFPFPFGVFMLVCLFFSDAVYGAPEMQLDQETLPNALLATDDDWCLVIGDKVRTTNNTYSSAGGTLGKNLMVVLDALVLSGTVTFDVSGEALGDTLQKRTGGTIVLLARDVTVDQGASINLFAKGGYRY